MKPSAFIASSTEGSSVAYAIQENLIKEVEATVWDQGVFKPGNFTIEDLISALDISDIGIFVFTPDDIITIRDKTSGSIRDNVIFELGIFIGKLGRRKSIIVMPVGTEEIHIPTDLTGITTLRYDPNRFDDNLVAALGPACNTIKQTLKKINRDIKEQLTPRLMYLLRYIKESPRKYDYRDYYPALRDFDCYQFSEEKTAIHYAMEALSAYELIKIGRLTSRGPSITMTTRGIKLLEIAKKHPDYSEVFKVDLPSSIGND